MTDMPLQAVLFDLWETLIIDLPERARPRQLRRADTVGGVLAAHDVKFEAGALLDALDRAGTALGQLHDEGRDLDSRGRADLVLSLLGADPSALPAGAIEDIEAAITVMPEGLTPLLRPDAIETLVTLKSLGLRTGLVSNAGFTTAPSLRWLLEHHGLLPHLDALVFSDELLAAKPNPIVFEQALSAVGAGAAACAFVGDSPHNDIAGADAVGLFTVQIGAKTHATIKPRAHITALGELIPALRSHDLIPPSAVASAVDTPALPNA